MTTLSTVPSVAFRPSCHGTTRSLTPLPTTRNIGVVKAGDRARPLRAQANAAAGDRFSDGKRWFDMTIDSANKVFEKLPEPVRRFPWGNFGATYVNALFELLASVTKVLAVPLLAVSSLSEMSYCAHQGKMIVVPFPFVAGVALAWALRQTFKDLSVDRKDEEFPWDLVLMALFFLLLKLPGPYYPYIGRLIMPHFANGGLWSTLWFGFQLLRKSPGYHQ